MKTKIRCVLTATLLTSAALSFCVSAETLILSHGYPPRHDVVAKGIEPWMKCVTEQVGPSVNFKYFPSGQIASAKDSLDAVTSGLVQISTAPVGYLSDKMPLSGISMLPNMGRSSLQAVNAFRGMLDRRTEFANEFEKNQVVPLLINMLPAYQVVSRAAPIDTLAAFKGKVLRSGGGTMSIAIGALKAAPAEMNGGDIYVALQRGTLDGVVASISGIKPYSIQELVKSISNNVNLGTFPTVLIIGRQAYEQSPPEVQKAMVACGRKTEQALARYLDQLTDQLNREFAQMGIRVYAVPEKDLKEINGMLAEVAKNYVGRLERRGFPADKVYSEYQSLLKNAEQVSAAR